MLYQKYIFAVIVVVVLCFSLEANAQNYSIDATEMNNTTKFNVVKWNVHYSCTTYDQWFSEKPGLVTDGKSWVSGNSGEFGYYTFHRFNRNSYTCIYTRTPETIGKDGYGENTAASKRDTPFSSLKREGNYYVLDLREFKGYVPLYLPYSESHNKSVWEKGALILEWLGDDEKALESEMPSWLFENDWSFLSSDTELILHLGKSDNSVGNPYTITSIDLSTHQSTSADGNYTFSDGAIVLDLGEWQLVLKIDNLEKCLTEPNGHQFTKKVRVEDNGNATSTSVSSETTFSENVETIPFQMVEQKPSFNGCDSNGFLTWVKENIKVPVKEGRIIISMLVDYDGNVKKVRVIRGLDPELDNEVVRVASSSPQWSPGRQNGKPVNVDYSAMPIVFSSSHSGSSGSNSSISSRQASTDSDQITASTLPGTIWQSIDYKSRRLQDIRRYEFLSGNKVRFSEQHVADDRPMYEPVTTVRDYSVLNSSTIRMSYYTESESGARRETFKDFKIKNESGNYSMEVVNENHSHDYPLTLISIKGRPNKVSVNIVTPEAIDLGLSVKWASFNIGASKPEESGAFYAWAETESKREFDWSSFKYGKPSNNPNWDNNFTKYNDFTGMEILRPEDDVAHTKLGGKWRTPTMEEFKELFDENNCSVSLITINGVNGCLITSKKTGFIGNSIFIPASGYYDGLTKKNANESCVLWSSSRYAEGVAKALVARSGYGYNFYNWCCGLPVRAVQDDNTRNEKAEKSAVAPKGAVDLGLSVYWASCNVGASSIESIGDYYAWGETTTKSGYYWDNYKWGTDDFSLTKYNTQSLRGTVDNKTTLSLEDDAAHVKIGGDWRMPSAEEVKELINNCTWVWTTINGVNGLKFTSKKPGFTDKWIFLPAAGTKSDRTILYGSIGKYWTSSIANSGPTGAFALHFYGNDVRTSQDDRINGCPIRPVTK